MKCSKSILLLLPLICFFHFQKSKSQDYNRDSLIFLINALKHHTLTSSSELKPSIKNAQNWLGDISDSRLHFEYYQHLGFYYYNENKFTKAVWALDHALDRLEHTQRRSTEACSIYEYLGYSYKELSVNNRAISFLEQAICCVNKNKVDGKKASNISLNLFQFLYDISKYDAAIELGNKLPALLDAADADLWKYLEINVSMAYSYMYKNQYEIAKQYIDRAEKVFQRMPRETMDLSEIRFRGCQITYILDTKGSDYDELLNYMDEWAKEFDHTTATQDDRIAFYYRQAGYRAMAFQYKEAMEAADSLVTLNTIRDKNRRIIVPELNNLNNTNYYNLVHAEIALRLYMITKDTNLLVKSLQSIQDNLDIYDYSRRTLLDIDQRKESLEFVYETIVLATAIYWESYRADLISAESFWALSEKYRSSHLRESKYAKELKSIYQDIPSELKMKEQSLIDSLYLLQKNEELKQKNRGKYYEKSSELLESLYDYQLELGKKYPNYYAQRLEQKYPLIEEIQFQLDSTKVIVEFLQGNDSEIDPAWYAFIISRDTFKIVQLKSKGIKELVNAYYENLKTNPFTYESKQVLTESIKTTDSLGVRLRKSLFDSLNIYDFENWIIIPQSYLNYLPTSTLPINNAVTRDLKHSTDRLRFIDRFNISYAFSAQWWIEGHFITKETKAYHSGVALMPQDNHQKQSIGFQERHQFMESKLWNIKYPTEEGSIQKKLRETHFDILYIAAHAKYVEDDEESLIYFDDRNPTFGWQIRRWPLKGKQVVMAACETQLGPNSKAEGMLGISYYLAAAGAHSITGSLWKVPDKTATEVLSPGKYVTNNMSSKKIVKVIRNYRAETEPIYKLPYFWGAFWTYEQDSIKKKEGIYNYTEWCILLILALGTTIVIRYRIKL